jgi:FkbM family methyltransferase
MLPETEIVHGVHADFLCFKTNDFISNHIREKGIWGEAELNLALLFSGGMEKPLILDIGANLGAFSIPVAKILASADAIVYAFEAQRIVFQQLCANAILNRLGNVIACHAAVGSSAGIARIPKVDYENTLNIGAVSLLPEIQKVSQVAYSDTEHEEIRMISIDSLGLEGRCTFVKIDVEGFESEVISGMLGFLEKNSFPPVFFEEWRKGKFGGAAGAEVEMRQARTKSNLAALGYDFNILGTNVIAQHPDAAARVGLVRQDDQTINLVRLR